MQIEILSRKQQRDFIKQEVKKVEAIMFKELNKMRRKVLKLEEENSIIRRLIR